jgi:formylglycine-generating enzyme required for sulfatase activity
MTMFNARNIRNTLLVATTAALAVGCDKVPEYDGDGPKMEFVRIPAGTFYMGSVDSEHGRDDNEGPIHEVRITKPFYMGKYEVTQAQWKAVMGTTLIQQHDKANSPWLLKGEGPEHPMYYVSWEEAVEFCKRLGRKFRLPTEAEWEYACRAGSRTRFYYGDDPNESELSQYAWWWGNSDSQTHPVGQKKPNAWGLHDMHGNVREWCSDRFVIMGNYKGAGSVDPTGSASAKGSFRVCRGGSWLEKPNSCRSASRGGLISRCDLIGFRVVYTGRGSGKEVLEMAPPQKSSVVPATLDKESESRPRIIAGVVCDEAGLPIDDVEMRILPTRSGFLRPYAEGRFEIYRYPSDPNTPMHGYHLIARHEQRNLAVCMEIEEDTNALDIKLEPGVILTGKVVNNDGEAVEGAIIAIFLQGSDWDAVIPPLGFKTDAEGKFTFRALPRRCRYICHVRLLHYRPSKFEFNTDDAPDNQVDLGSIVLASGPFSVSGIVVDANGKPVPHVWVYCTGKGQAGINSETDEHGRFKADGIFEGQVDIKASVKGNDGGWLGGSVSVKAGATNVKIMLRPGGMPPPKGRACFPADTDVWVDGELVQISEVVSGQMVGGRDVSFGQIEEFQEHVGAFEYRDILLENGNRIGVTGAHCFLLDSGRWVAAQNLRGGLRLKTLTGTIRIGSVTTRATLYVGKVCNLRIKGSDQYPVGKDGVIVRDY